MSTIADRRAVIERVRQENESDYGDRARRAVQKLLSASLPHPWTYVYELTQNALDACAQRISWGIDGESVLFQHDGRIALDESHVHGIASLGASTKGLAHVGFMGVGFKSIFARFRRVSVSGFGFRFKFDVGVHHGDLGQKNTQWFDTLLPHWDDDARDPDVGYTTSIRLERPVVSARTVAEDIERISSPEDQTPLAVLGFRGLKHIRVDDIEWIIDVDADVVDVRRHNGESMSSWRWKSFVSRYRPDDDAMRRFLEVRQETHDQVDGSGKRIKRAVVGLVPLDGNGRPDPPRHGGVYATLPTQVPVPFGFHLQADWFVDVDRQNLRDVDGDAWQELIVRQVPEIVRQFLVWLTGQSDQARKQGYRALCDPGTDEGPLSKPFKALRDRFVDTLADQKIVPIHGTGPRQFRTPEKVARLPNRFSSDFGRHPQWRPDLLFDPDLMDEELLSTSATKFTTWLCWGREIERDTVPWPDNLPEWWNALPEDMRKEALFALWHGVGELGWHDAPVVPTEAGTWVQMRRIRWLNEAPPTENNPGGTIIASALADYLPRRDERVPPNIRSWVDNTDHDGIDCFASLRTDVMLSSLIREAFKDSEGKSDTRLVALLEWALNRGISRQDLVPLVLTEHGAKRPADALLADPLVDGGIDRRKLFPDKPALIGDYASINYRHIVAFLERLGLCGGDPLAEISTSVSCYNPEAVATMLGIDKQWVSRANASGYTVLDYEFPFQLEKVAFDALQNWLSFGHAALHGKGSKIANWSYYGKLSTPGTSGTASWVRSLQAHPWLLCTDGQRRKPADALLKPDPDFEDAPIAEIDPSLGNRLKEEGVQFGSNAQKSPALRRLSRRGALDMPDSDLAALLHEACEQVALGHATQEDLLEALNDVRLRGVPMARVVQRTGPGKDQRSDLGGWIAALEDVEPSLAETVKELPLSVPVPETTTGRQALDFLRNIWITKPPRVEEIRRNLAAAYRYVLDDLDSGDLPDDEWRQARDLTCVYGQNNWHTIGESLVVADVHSPLIRQFLPEGRVVVASAHLGDSDGQVRRVANALGLGLLSNDVKVCPGSRVEDPSWIVRLWKLVGALSLLEGRIELQEISFRDKISLRVSGTERHINAYVLDGALLLVGGPPEFAADAAEQLVDRFQLGQRGNVVPYLTMALSSLDNKDYFSHNLKVLCEGLGVEVPEDASDLASNEAWDRSDEAERADQSNEDDNADDHKTDHDESERWAEKPGPHAASQAGRMTDDGTSQMEYRDRLEGDDSAASERLHDGEGTTQTTGNDRPSPRGRAADHFGLSVEREMSEDQDQGTSRGNRGGRMDDHKARQAVIDYETRQGRKPKEMPDNQPGYDVLSVDGASGKRRRIEVKGVQGIFQDDASVVLTARQAHDAIQHSEQRSETNDNYEYWLYVVDSTETANPRVFPIPWTRYRLRYGFYARVWADIAEQPTCMNRDII